MKVRTAVNLGAGFESPLGIAGGRVEANEAAVDIAKINRAVMNAGRRGDAGLAGVLPYRTAIVKSQSEERAVEIADIDVALVDDRGGFEGAARHAMGPDDLERRGQCRAGHAGSLRVATKNGPGHFLRRWVDRGLGLGGLRLSRCGQPQ